MPPRVPLVDLSNTYLTRVRLYTLVNTAVFYGHGKLDQRRSRGSGVSEDVRRGFQLYALSYCTGKVADTYLCGVVVILATDTHNALTDVHSYCVTSPRRVSRYQYLAAVAAGQLIMSPPHRVAA